MPPAGSDGHGAAGTAGAAKNGPGHAEASHPAASSSASGRADGASGQASNARAPAQDEPHDSDDKSDHADDGGGPAVTTGFASEPEDPATYLFDQTKLLTYNIQVAPNDLAKLDRDPSAEQYVGGTLEFEGQKYGPIGVRYKGGYSGFQPPCSYGTGAQRIGKCSIKLAFDEADSKGRFFGLKKLNLHSMDFDPSLMHDRLGYALFREFGVAAPRAVHARIYLNGVPLGLYVVVEQIDGRFTRARFADGGKGNLYKEVWPLYADPSVYTNALETNQKAGRVQGMLALHDAVSTGTPAAVARVIDRDYTLRYAAVDRVIINDDGMFHFWCSSGVANGNNPNGSGNHNYYWYEEESAKKLWLLPWDLDLTFSFTADAHIVVPWNRAAKCRCLRSGTGFQLPSSCDPLVGDFIKWGADYDRQVAAFLAGPFSPASISAKLDTWISQIAPSVAEFANTQDAQDVATWQHALDELRKAIESARAHRGYAY